MRQAVPQPFDHLFKPAVFLMLPRDQPRPSGEARGQLLCPAAFGRRIGMGIRGRIHLGGEADFGHATQIGRVDFECTSDPNQQSTANPASVVLDQVEVARGNFAGFCQFRLAEPAIDAIGADARAG